MTNIPDEMLMAYADNELSPREREEIDARLKVDPELRARLTPFVTTGTSLAAFFNEPLYEPVPARLIEAVATPPSKARGGPRSRAVQGGGWLETIGSFLFPDSPRLAAAFGLAALLIAGGTAGWVIGRESSATLPSNTLVALNHGELVAAGPLLTALESEPSKVLGGDIPSPDRILPVQSFHSHEGAFCREYRAGGAGGQTISGVACRQPNGNWRIAAHVETPPAGPSSETSDYQTASGPGSEALNAVVDSLIEGDVLGAEDEAAAIARKWARTAR